MVPLNYALVEIASFLVIRICLLFCLIAQSRYQAEFLARLIFTNVFPLLPLLSNDRYIYNNDGHSLETSRISIQDSKSDNALTQR